MRMQVLFLSSLLASILPLTASCSIPESKIYSVYIKREAAPQARGTASLIISLDADRMLAQPYIVYRDSPYQLRISGYSKWDSPPVRIVAAQMEDAFHESGIFDGVHVSDTFTEGLYALKVDLHRFEEFDEPDGTFAQIEFDCELIAPDGKPLFYATLLKRRRLEDKSFLSLAKGMSEALQEAIAEVRDKTNAAVGKGR
jgi:ABC-type uncharacterized transport system auxiliary subunit